MFFKSIRDGMKANAFVSHLELANQRFSPTDLWFVTNHLAEAQKALIALRKAEAEDMIEPVGWVYVAGICTELTLRLEACGQAQLARDAQYIHDYAGQRAKL